MAIPATAVWEVRTTGLATNSGGYDPAGGGTDYSLQDTPQYSVTDLVIDAVTNTKCTSATIGFTAAHVGNSMIISAGTGFTVQTVFISSVAAGVATCDKSLGTLGSTGGTAKLGGAKLGIENVAALVVAGNTVYIASGTYTKTTTRTMTVAGTVVLPIKVIGYPVGGSRIDQDITVANMPILTSATNSISLLTHNAASNWFYRNISFTHTAATRGTGLANATAVSTGLHIRNCSFDGCLDAILVGSTSATAFLGVHIARCTVKNSTSHGIAIGVASSATSGVIIDSCDISANAGAGISLASGFLGNLIIKRNVIRGNTGANGHGVWCQSTTTNYSNGQLMLIENNVFYSNAQTGVKFAFTTGRPAARSRCKSIFSDNPGYDASCATSGIFNHSYARIENNAYYATGTGARQNISTATTDVTLTSVPFTNAGSGDFSLNQTVGSGGAVRQVGWSSAIGAAGVTVGTSYPDIGPVGAQITSGFVI